MTIPIGSLVKDALTTARELVESRSVVLIQRAQAGYVEGRPVGSTTQTETLVAMVSPWSLRGGPFVEAEQLKRETLKVVAAKEGMSLVPSLNDTLQVDGKAYTIVGLQKPVGAYVMAVTR